VLVIIFCTIIALFANAFFITVALREVLTMLGSKHTSSTDRDRFILASSSSKSAYIAESIASLLSAYARNEQK
jgi:hypothetical protein